MKGWVRLRILPMFVLLAVGACADGPHEGAPLAPAFAASASQGGGNPAGPDLKELAKLKPGRARPTAVLNKVIGPEGDSLRIGDFEIVVPPGAVSKKTPFRIKLPGDPNGAEYSYAEFHPSGTFLKPVIIRLPFANTNAEPDASVVWWSGSEWVPIPSRITPDGRIEAETSHFSVYGTSFRFKGVTILGG